MSDLTFAETVALAKHAALSLRADADYNRSWTDGWCLSGEMPTDSHIVRCLEVAEECERRAEAIERLCRMTADHARHVAELLEANNREVERRREAEAVVEAAREVLRSDNLAMNGLFGLGKLRLALAGYDAIWTV